MEPQSYTLKTTFGTTPRYVLREKFGMVNEGYLIFGLCASFRLDRITLISTIWMNLKKRLQIVICKGLKIVHK